MSLYTADLRLENLRNDAVPGPQFEKLKARLTTKEDAWIPWPIDKVGDGSLASSLVEAEAS
jgi:hypothetical protein